ncbi:MULTISPECIES: hypothetical protein [unclassified Novosphingobium]|uniref:hypothetical protein n=1 Tax=unclassified Novosphingobium TaxID=2644732 RepID=UPI00105F8246|nr:MULTISPECIES: hypothetical protein [unclassified Novosphingobium]
MATLPKSGGVYPNTSRARARGRRLDQPLRTPQQLSNNQIDGAFVKKSECEKAIRHLASQWADEVGVQPGQARMPSFSAFRSWLEQRGYGHYLSFRSVMGPLEDAEQWFDEELKQTWRN